MSADRRHPPTVLERMETVVVAVVVAPSTSTSTAAWHGGTQQGRFVRESWLLQMQQQRGLGREGWAGQMGMLAKNGLRHKGHMCA